MRSHVCRERFSWERGSRSDLLRNRGHVSPGAPLLCGRLWCRARVLLPCDARRRRGEAGTGSGALRSWSGGRQVARCDTIRYTPGDRSLRTQRSGVAAAGLMLGERAWPRRAGCWELGGLPGLVASPAGRAAQPSPVAAVAKLAPRSIACEPCAAATAAGLRNVRHALLRPSPSSCPPTLCAPLRSAHNDKASATPHQQRKQRV